MRNSFVLSILAFSLAPGIVVAQGDECTDPKPVTVGSYGPYSTVGATSSLPAVWPCEPTAGNDVWFVAQANANGTATFDTCGSSFDTVLEVFDGTGGCGALVSLGCNDDSCGTRSLVTVNVTPGLLLYVRVGGWNLNTGSFVLNVAGDLGTVSGFADANNYGLGCYDGRASFYESITNPANFDLSNSSFTMVPANGGYIVTAGLSPFVPPTGTAQGLAMGDDSVVSVNLTLPFPIAGGSTGSLEVCSNGYVSTDPGNGQSAVINVVGFLNSPAASWRCWHDYDPSAGGQVLFEEIAGVAYITWDQVPDWNVPGSASTWQFQFDTTSGFVTYAFQQMSLTGSGGGGNGHLIGYAPGGASLDPGNTDLSVAIPAGFSVLGADLFDLKHDASDRPVIGTSISLETSNVPATAPIGLQLLGFVQINPGLDLAVIGMPNCRAYVQFLVSLAITPSGSTAAFPLTIPNNPALAGQQLFAQSAMLVPGVNAFGAVSSNGVDLRLDVN
tara:strand:- start:3731 stop:5230 length:1500 start_codon:yes stop_codon:yes gene_type:complete